MQGVNNYNNTSSDMNLLWKRMDDKILKILVKSRQESKQAGLQGLLLLFRHFNDVVS